METKKNQFWNKAMEWGLYIGLAIIVLTTVYYISDSYMAKSRGWIEYLVYAAGIVMCALAYKKTLTENDTFAYGRALGLGVATMLFASIIMALFTFIFFTYVAPELLDEMILTAEEALLQAGLPDSMIEQQMNIQRLIMRPLPLSIMTIFGTVFTGLIISLITSIFMRIKPASGFDNAMNEIEDEK
jgi:hypothetical protein